MTARIIMKLRVGAVDQMCEDVKAFRLVHPTRPHLPAWAPGAHVDVQLSDGKVRQYSLVGTPDDLSEYRIVVKRETGGRGGSAWLHDHLKVGDELHVSAARNNFPLDLSADKAILIAGGIGVTPIFSMVRALKSAGKEFELHYCFRSRANAPLLAELQDICGPLLIEHAGEDGAEHRLNMSSIIGEPQPGLHVYCCGPERLVSDMENLCADWPEEQVHAELFQMTLDENYNPEPFDLHIASTDQTFRVPADRSALDVLREEGFVLPSSCELGVCGSCECGYSDGTVIHRDKVLKTSARQNRMMLCVSRARVSITVEL